MNNPVNNKNGFGMIAVLIALLIIGLICYLATKNLKDSSSKPFDSMSKDAGIDTSSYKGMIDSAKKATQDAEKRYRLK